MMRFLDDNPQHVRTKVFGLLGLLVLANLLAWGWALFMFHGYPLLLGLAFLAWSLGLRHAVDADHIAAIDNVTRKLMQEGKRPVSVGLMFSLGHSTVVVVATVLIAASAMALHDEMQAYHGIGGIIGTSIAAAFLFLIAAMNAVAFVGQYQAFRRVRRGEPWQPEDIDTLLAQGPFVRMCRPLFRTITRSWHMYPLGLLFGLGFDTAAEVALLGIASAEAARDLPLWSILVFPALFTVGMTLIDTLDNVLMLRVYGWAFIKPVRKLYYNMTVTFMSLFVALVIGGIQALGLIGDRLALTGVFWQEIGDLAGHLGLIGYAVIAIFLATWGLSALIWRWGNYDRLEAASRTEQS